MQDRIIIIATLTLLKDKLQSLTKTVKEIQAHCSKTEEGMLQYDWYLSESSDTIKVIETYKDSEAVLFHFDNYKPFASRLNADRVFVSLEIYGKANDALVKRVQKINAQHYKAISIHNKLS